MSNQHRASRLAKHELHRAYEIIFGRNPRGAGVILERETLARTFRERANQFQPNRARELGKPKRELQDAIKAIAIAFDLLADVVGTEDKVWVGPWVDNTQIESVRPWAIQSMTSPNKVVNTRTKNSLNNMEQASQRIKEAITKLRQQTEALAKGRAQPAQAPATENKIPALSKETSPKSLILGRHLHRRGLISLRQLIAAVAWQRQQRPAVGQIAKAWGILNDEQVFEVLREKDSGELFCDSAVRRGLMTPFQRLAVVGRQRVMQKPIGQYFIENGILSEQQIKSEVDSLKAHQRSQDENAR